MWKKIVGFVASWPVMTKVVVPLSVVLLLIGATLLAMVLRDNLDVDVLDSTEEETQLTELTVTELETEMPEPETETELPLVVLPTIPHYESVTMMAESIEKDLTVYLENENDSNITNVHFQVKLITGSSLPQDLQEAVAAIGDTDIFDYEPPADYADMVLSEEDLVALKKQEAIAAYASVLAATDGQVLTDDTGDGVIYADGLTAGDYMVCFVPVEGYDATEYAISVTVKDTIEYKVVETVIKKTVSDKAAGDPQTSTKKVTTVESVAKDTVTTVESVVEETSQAEYSSGKTMDLGIAASVSDEMNSTTTTSEQAVGGSYENTTTVTVDSMIAINKELKLYSNDIASSAIVKVESSNVTNLSLTASSEISDNLTITEVDGGYRVELTVPTKYKNDTTGTLTLSATDTGGDEIQTACAVTIIGADTLLYDSEGRQLYYVDASGTEQPGTVGTYTTSTLYDYVVKDAEVTYHGWQTIDGKTYYYDENGNAVTGTQVIGGVTYYFASDGSLITESTGIDVSKWQGTIDWQKVSTVVSFAIIRCGFRGTSGNMAEDPTYLTNITAAKKNGIKVGIYFYSMATTEAQAVEEASLAVSLAKQTGSLDLPIFIDMEDNVQRSLTTAQRDAIVTAFCKTVASSGYTAGIYASKSWLEDMLTMSKFSSYMVWCAQYNTKCTYSGRYEIWQYSCQGTVPGITGYVDMNQGYF